MVEQLEIIILLKADRELVLIAVKQDGLALEHASVALQQDKELRKIAGTVMIIVTIENANHFIGMYHTLRDIYECIDNDMREEGLDTGEIESNEEYEVALFWNEQIYELTGLTGSWDIEPELRKLKYPFDWDVGNIVGAYADVDRYEEYLRDITKRCLI